MTRLVIRLRFAVVLIRLFGHLLIGGESRNNKGLALIFFRLLRAGVLGWPRVARGPMRRAAAVDQPGVGAMRSAAGERFETHAKTRVKTRAGAEKPLYSADASRQPDPGHRSRSLSCRRTGGARPHRGRAAPRADRDRLLFDRQSRHPRGS